MIENDVETYKLSIDVIPNKVMEKFEKKERGKNEKKHSAPRNQRPRRRQEFAVSQRRWKVSRSRLS